MKDYIYQQTKIRLTDEQCAKLDKYCEFLLAENEKYNLTAITSPSEVWEKHFADSILGSVAIPNGAKLCDIGSGAGFPAIPLKVARQDLDVTLVDSLDKRVNFCNSICQQMGVDAQFFHERAEDFAKTHSENYDVATARAVAPLNILLEYTAQIVKLGGIVLAYKTDFAETETANNACKVLGLRLETHYDFVLPSGANRCLLVYRKVAHTPKQYPRGQNKPRKLPL